MCAYDFEIVPIIWKQRNSDLSVDIRIVQVHKEDILWVIQTGWVRINDNLSLAISHRLYTAPCVCMRQTFGCQCRDYHE